MNDISESAVVTAIIAACDLIEEHIGDNNRHINKIRKAVGKAPKKKKKTTGPPSVPGDQLPHTMQPSKPLGESNQGEV